jgi:hypothetical protein
VAWFDYTASYSNISSTGVGGYRLTVVKCVVTLNPFVFTY